MSQIQRTELTQTQVMRLSQQQLRYVRMLEMTAPEVEEAVERELEDNPALTVDEDERDAGMPKMTRGELMHVGSRGKSDDSYEYVVPDTPETLREHLMAQLSERGLTPEVEATARYLVDSVDANGYLRGDMDQMLDDMAIYHSLDVSGETMDEALAVLQSLEPAGVGARTLRECLLLQLRRLDASEERDDALRIVEDQFEAFSMKKWHRLVSTLRITQERVNNAIGLIRRLNPKPGSAFGDGLSEAGNIIIPDFAVDRDEATGRLTVSVCNRIPELRIDSTFEEAYRNLRRDSRGKVEKGNEFIYGRYGDAVDFIRILRQRQETMFAVMTAIVALQKEYFETEDVYRMRPMMIKDIAALTGLDISTISRATANKYVTTSWGVFPLRFFFSDSVGESADTEALTNRKIEAEIRKIVEHEDKRHPLSDDKIRQVMNERGFDLSRRTVTKYRERCGIPVARLRVGF